jgi:hypothetical protein
MMALCAILAFSACRTTRDTATSTISHTETTVAKVPRDTLIPVPREEVHQVLTLPVPVPDVPPQTKAKGRATSTLSVKGGKVQADCVCDTASIKARLWDTWTKEHQDTTVTTVTKIVKQRLPWWFWVVLTLAGITILAKAILSFFKPI